MNRTIKLFLTICIISICNIPIQAQHAGLIEDQIIDDEIEEFIQIFYKDTWKTDETTGRYIYLSEYLNELFRIDYESKVEYLSDGKAVFTDTPKPDFDPFINAQDTPDDLKIELTSILKREYASGKATSKATILVNVFCFGEDKQMKYNLITESGRWVVDNVIYETDGKETFNFQKYMK